MTKTEWKLAERANEIKDLRWMLQKTTDQFNQLKLDHYEEVKELRRDQDQYADANKELREELSYWRNDHELARDKWEEFLISNIDRAGKM